MQAGEERSPDSHIRLVADTLLSRGRLVKGGPPLGEVLELDQVPDRGERRADDGLHGVEMECGQPKQALGPTRLSRQGLSVPRPRQSFQ